MAPSLPETPGAWTPCTAGRATRHGTIASGLVAVPLEVDLLQLRVDGTREGRQLIRGHLEQRSDFDRVELEPALAQRPERRTRVARIAGAQALVGGEPTDHDLHALLAHALAPRKGHASGLEMQQVRPSRGLHRQRGPGAPSAPAHFEHSCADRVLAADACTRASAIESM